MTSLARYLSPLTIYPYLSDEEKEFRERFETRLPYTIEAEYVPTDFRQFYFDFGKIRHQETNEIIHELAPYQYELASDPALSIECVKCQKSGISTTELIHDFQETLLPVGRGKDCLIGAQNQKHAIEHIDTLKRLIIESEKYRKYMITDSKELYFKEQKTKMQVIYIKNPDNPFRPSRIIGLPFRLGSFSSWKNVFRVHLSDPAFAPIVNDGPVYAAAKGRLANTNGRLMVEGPPNGPKGLFYEWYEQYKDNSNPNFQIHVVVDEDAKLAGVISPEFLAQAKLDLGPLYPQYYQASFLEGVGYLFTKEMIEKATQLGIKYRDDPINPFALHYGGIDPESKAAVYVGELDIDNQIFRIIRVIRYPREATPSEIAKDVHDLHEEIPNLYWFVDGNHKGYVNELKSMFGEPRDWETASDLYEDDSVLVKPVNFSTKHKNMLINLYNYVDKGWLAIDPELCKELLKALKTARHKGFALDKKQTVNNDDLDATRLMLEGIRIEIEE